ncbi:WD40-like Beta Propeller Repeat [Mucilaginibacter gossypiicola]|uniref:WD40-like Beta Propeller Repeat n=1 Tax=Mucilaginibacter gossypiicola TaxID=551995 RepID=A0A1H8LRR5_9SPHI|nr:PD40 domain-containing protein [Mucilaginibacter gossypiicola]SEO07793.1 WD40-like Beta Propeller Repeat [Mucilaginibacter gossypiicola]
MNNHRYKITGVIVYIFLLIEITSCREKETPINISTTTLCAVPNPVNITVTPDGRHTMFVVTEGNKQHVVFDGVAGPEFEGVYVERSFMLSPDGKRTAYIVASNIPAPNNCKTCGPPGKWRAIIDNHFEPEYEKILNIAFSNDAKQFAYAAMKKRNDGSNFWTVVVNGHEEGCYNAISKLSPQFNLDGKKIVSVVRRENQKSIVVVNNTESEDYDYIGYGIPIFSPDGKHMAYSARDFKTNLAIVVFDGKAGNPYNAVPERSLVFSPDSKSFAYGAQIANNWQVVANNVPEEKYLKVDNIQYSPDGKHLTYKAQKGGKWMVVTDGKEGFAVDSLMKGFPVFSADGKNTAYGYKKSGKWHVVVEQVDTQENINQQFFISNFEKGYDEIIACFFSPDNKHLSFIVREGNKKKVINDGIAENEFDDIVPNLTYSPDSKHIAYLARIKEAGDKKKLVVLDGSPGPEFDDILNENLSFILFSRDSRHVSYAAASHGKWSYIIDGQSMKAAYDTICNLVDAGLNGFESIAVNDGKLYLLKWGFGG